MIARSRVTLVTLWATFAVCVGCGSASTPGSDSFGQGGNPGQGGAEGSGLATGGDVGTGGTGEVTGTGGTAAKTVGSTETINETLLIDDADDGDELNKLSGKWISYDDRLDKGSSKVNPPAWIEGVPFTMGEPGYGGSPYAVHMTGTTGSILGYDYVGLVMALGPHCFCPDPEPPETTLAPYRGIRFQAKATRRNGGSYSLIIAHRKEGTQGNCSNGIIGNTLTEWADYQLDLTPLINEDWTLVTIDFRKDLHQPNFGNYVDQEQVLTHAKDVVWQYQNANGGDANLWIDNVELFR